MSNSGKFVLIDRDGVITVRRPDYTKTADELLLMPFAAEAILAFRQKGINVIIYHHELGVAQGALDAKTVAAVNNRMIELLEEQTIPDVATAVVSTDTPVTPEVTEIKVKAGLLLRAAKDYGINLKQAWVIGDDVSDMEAAKLVGARSCLVRVGKGHLTARHYAFTKPNEYKPELVVKDLFAASTKIHL